MARKVVQFPGSTIVFTGVLEFTTPNVEEVYEGGGRNIRLDTALKKKFFKESMKPPPSRTLMTVIPR